MVLYTCFVHRCIPVGVSMLFSNQKVFLDVKDYCRIDQLEADIHQFGGIIEKFLSKDITCIITNRGRVDNLKDVSASPSLRPTCGNKVMSRGQSLLMRSNSLKDASACDPVMFAQTWGIKTVTLDMVLKAIERQLSTCAPSSPVSKQSDKSHDVKKKRKISATSVKEEDKESKIRPFVTKFSGPFVKFEDTQSNFRPFFHQYSSFPHLNFEGDLSNGIFSCAKNLQPVVARKNVSVIANTRKQKAWSKRGYCECCDTMYDDLNQHVSGVNHKRFAEHVDNFADLDKLIDQIHSLDGSVMLLPSEDKCRHHVSGEVVLTDHAQEMNDNRQLTGAAVSASSRNANLRTNQFPDQDDEPEQPDKVVSVVKISEETGNKSTMHVSIDAMNTDTVSLENQHMDSDVSDKLHSQRLSVHCNIGNSYSVSNTVSKSVDSCKIDGGLRKLKLCDVSTVANQSHDDDSSHFISSNYVLNLLEVLSSENSVDPALNAEKARCSTVEVCEGINQMNSAAECCIPFTCSYNSAHLKLTVNEKDKNVDKSSFLLACPQTDLLGQFDARTVTEHPSNNTEICTAKSEKVSDSDLPDLSTVTIDSAVTLKETSLSVNINKNHNDAKSCNVIVDNGAPVLPLHELMDNNSYVSPAAFSVDQPAISATSIKSEPDVPGYADCQANSDCAFGDGALLPVPTSESIAESFDLHDKLLKMACEPDIVQHGNSLHASNPCSADTVDFSTSSNNNFCLPFVFSLPLYLSEDSAPVADCSDVGLCTPAHSCSNPLEKPTANNTTLTKSTPTCHKSPFSGIMSFIESAAVNDGLQSSVPYMGLQSNIDIINSVSDKQVDECHVPEKRYTQIKRIECNKSAKCTSPRESEFCCRSTPLAATQLDATFVDDGLCHTNSFNNIPGFLVPKFSELSLHSGCSNKSSVVEPVESFDVIEPVAEADANAGNDSASTLIYSCDHLSSSLLEHASDENSRDRNKSETTADHEPPAASSPSSMWKVISCVDCRMRLIRTEDVCPTSPTQNTNKVNMPSVLERELQDANHPVEQADVISDTRSTNVYCSDSPKSGIADYTEPTVSSADSVWKVVSFADCRMRLVRTQVVLPSSSTPSASSDSRHWYANNSCNVGVQFILPKTTDKVLSC